MGGLVVICVSTFPEWIRQLAAVALKIILFCAICFPLSNCSYGIFFFNDSGCSDLLWRKVWRSVGLENTFVFNLPLSPTNTDVSKKFTFMGDILKSNLMVWWHWFKISMEVKNSCLDPAHIPNVSSIKRRYSGHFSPKSGYIWSFSNFPHKYVCVWRRAYSTHCTF